jgi:hypothetical protein
MIDEDAMLKKYRPAFFEFYDMGMEARRLKNMRVKLITCFHDSLNLRKNFHEIFYV